ncbi:hypothetical protein [Rubritalea marina]|uniref:hypothetical protein n=1 Tax=Rubritalea marina TaxID=361055 RepID=UPI001969E0A9|nr:hypothetical protein [Rubritalea marina]
MKSFIFLAACSSAPDAVDVREYHLRDLERVNRDNPIIRAEQQKRLRGAVSYKERRDRLGQYYSVSWSLPHGHGNKDVRVVFLYQQADTGHVVLTKEQRFTKSSGTKTCEFIFNGEEYRGKGRVLCWKVEAYADGDLIGSEQSYLWRDNR